MILLGFPGGTGGKESAFNVGDLGLTPAWGRSPGERGGYPLQYSGVENSMGSSPWGHKELDMTEQFSLHFNPLQYSCLENPMDRGAWQATVHRVTRSRTRPKQLSMHVHTFSLSLRQLWLLIKYTASFVPRPLIDAP